MADEPAPYLANRPEGGVSWQPEKALIIAEQSSVRHGLLQWARRIPHFQTVGAANS